jgi:hypothetical protein
MATSAIAKFGKARASISWSEVNLGSGGLHLYRSDELSAGQVGYAIAPDGSSLCTGKDGAWRSGWTVIGYDTGSGDPLIMDATDPALPVLRDFNGQGKWNPVKIAVSIEVFLSQLEEFARLAQGRGTPLELEANPLSHEELANFLARIFDLNNGQATLDFWRALVAAESEPV